MGEKKGKNRLRGGHVAEINWLNISTIWMQKMEDRPVEVQD